MNVGYRLCKPKESGEPLKVLSQEIIWFVPLRKS